MEERFRIAETLICPFILRGDGKAAPDERYSLRLCVIDEENEIAIDIKHKLQYNYIRTKSALYMQSKAINYIKDNKRAAVFACVTLLSSISDNKVLKDSKEIIENLKNGKRYPDGNEVLNNGEYLDLITKERIGQKVKKIGKKVK